MMDKIKSIVVLSVVCVIAAGGLAYVNKLTYEARNPAISPAMVKALNLLLPPHDNQLENDVLTVGENKYYVAKQGAEVAAYAFESAKSIRAAIDRTHVKHDAPIAGASEIAFFPPMTGG